MRGLQVAAVGWLSLSALSPRLPQTLSQPFLLVVAKPSSDGFLAIQDEPADPRSRRAHTLHMPAIECSY